MPRGVICNLQNERYLHGRVQMMTEEAFPRQTTPVQLRAFADVAELKVRLKAFGKVVNCSLEVSPKMDNPCTTESLHGTLILRDLEQISL